MNILDLEYLPASPHRSTARLKVRSIKNPVSGVNYHLTVWRALPTNIMRPPEDFDIVIRDGGTSNIEFYARLDLLAAQCTLHDILTRWEILKEE